MRVGPRTSPGCEGADPGRHGTPDVWVPQGPGDPELLDVRAAVHACRTACSHRRDRGRCPLICSWSRRGRRPAPTCTIHECHSDQKFPGSNGIHDGSSGCRRRGPSDVAWTAIAWLLHQYEVSWAYYLGRGASSTAVQQADRGDHEAAHEPLPYFTTVQETTSSTTSSPTRSSSSLQRRDVSTVSWVMPGARCAARPRPTAIAHGQG